jgi:hypothetical protein
LRRRPQLPKWRNWQTRYIQGVVPVREWRFESSLRHQPFEFFPSTTISFYPQPWEEGGCAPRPGEGSLSRRCAVAVPLSYARHRNSGDHREPLQLRRRCFVVDAGLRSPVAGSGIPPCGASKLRCLSQLAPADRPPAQGAFLPFDLDLKKEIFPCGEKASS